MEKTDSKYTSFSKWASKELKNPLDMQKHVNALWQMAQCFTPEGDYFKIRKALEMPTLAKEGRASREKLFEKVCAAAQTNLFNQFVVIKKQSAVDLVQVKENTLTGLIELKIDSDDIFHAAYEVIFYYFRLLHNKKEFLERNPGIDMLSTGFHLTVLAPAYFFVQHIRPKITQEATEQINREFENLNHAVFRQPLQDILLAEPKYQAPLLHFVQIPADNPCLSTDAAAQIRKHMQGDNVVRPPNTFCRAMQKLPLIW